MPSERAVAPCGGSPPATNSSGLQVLCPEPSSRGFETVPQCERGAAAEEEVPPEDLWPLPEDVYGFLTLRLAEVWAARGQEDQTQWTSLHLFMAALLYGP